MFSELELGWGEVIERRVSARVVVVGDVGRDLSPRGSDVLVVGHFEFGLDGSEARFHEGVVVAVAGAAHALTDVRAAQDRSVLCVRELCQVS